MSESSFLTPADSSRFLQFTGNFSLAIRQSSWINKEFEEKGAEVEEVGGEETLGQY